MRRSSGIILLFGFLAVSLVVVGARRAASDPPYWAYGLTAPAEGAPPLTIPAPYPAAPNPPAPAPAAGAPPANGRAPDLTPRRVAGAAGSFTTGDINNGYGPADWFPQDHPAMPDVVAHGKNGQARACSLCHMPNGKGRPENAPVAGQPYDYIVQQLSDFRNGLRWSAEPRKANTAEMIQIAKALTEDEIKEAAKYFSSMTWTPWIKVVEMDTIPHMRLTGNIFYRTDDGTTEPIGKRVIETPENTVETQLRNPRSGFLAYVPTGSLKRGEELVTTGANGRTLPCGVCHGPDLKGVGPLPGIAGRSPSYLARQLFDIQQGTRHGALAALMKPVVANLTEDDMIAIVAYVSSRVP